jgi:hypothetical protein
LWFDLDGLWEDRRDSHKGPRQAAPTVTDILVNARAGECVGNALTIFALPVLAIEKCFRPGPFPVLHHAERRCRRPEAGFSFTVAPVGYRGSMSPLNDRAACRTRL